MPDLADQSKWLGREGYLLFRHTVYSISTDHVCGIERKFTSGREAGCGWSRTSRSWIKSSRRGIGNVREEGRFGEDGGLRSGAESE